MATVTLRLDIDITELTDAIRQPKGKLNATPWFVKINRPLYTNSQCRSIGLSPLEQATYVHITFDRETEMLKVHLPRLKLDFFLRKGTTQLESKQFREMTVDPNQSISTLTGLVNKLVLRGTTDASRCTIIPHGDVHFGPEGYHVRVHIDTSM